MKTSSDGSFQLWSEAEVRQLVRTHMPEEIMEGRPGCPPILVFVYTDADGAHWMIVLPDSDSNGPIVQGEYEAARVYAHPVMRTEYRSTVYDAPSTIIAHGIAAWTPSADLTTLAEDKRRRRAGLEDEAYWFRRAFWGGDVTTMPVATILEYILLYTNHLRQTHPTMTGWEARALAWETSDMVYST